MSSHAELLSHSCSHCAKNAFFAPADSTIDVDQGIEGGCIWHKLAHAWLDRAFKNMLGLTHCPDSNHGALYKFGRSYIAADGRVCEFEWMVPCHDGPQSFYSIDGKRQMFLFSESTSSTATFTFLRKQMAECESIHDICGRKDQSDEILKGIRFLCIRGNLLVLEEAVVPARYACLSHCWGNAQNLLKTTQENKHIYMGKGILIEDLPKTYRDSVVVCKELGIQHLWIDSLCIVQNRSHDWDEQASRMAEVYQNAHVTIAAVAAQSSEEGLFNNTSDRLTSFPLPGYPWIHVRKQVNLPSTTHQFMDLNSDDGHALYKRGWTYQELSLSPRVIHYGRSEVIWHCQSKSCSECDPEGTIDIPQLVSTDWERLTEFRSIQGLWYSIVQSYSWRSLTFDKDRLPAIAAFASRIQQLHHRNKYVHGLWEETLHLDLLWAVNEWRAEECSSGPFSELESRSLPTWSWTSAKAPITWELTLSMDQFEKIPSTKITRVAYNTRGPPLLGDAIEAHIVIEAPIFKLRETHFVERTMDIPRNNYNDLGWWSPYWDTLFDVTDYRNECEEVLAIPLVMMKKRDVDIQGIRYDSNSLLIMKTDEVGKYKRVGIATFGLQGDFTYKSRRYWNTEISEEDKANEELQRERRYERFVQIMEQMEKHTIILI